MSDKIDRSNEINNKDKCLLRREVNKEEESLYYYSECLGFNNSNGYEDRFSIHHSGYANYKYCPHCGKKIEIDTDNWDSIEWFWNS